MDLVSEEIYTQSEAEIKAFEAKVLDKGGWIEIYTLREGGYHAVGFWPQELEVPAPRE